jgi:hypothetical protein
MALAALSLLVASSQSFAIPSALGVSLASQSFAVPAVRVVGSRSNALPSRWLPRISMSEGPERLASSHRKHALEKQVERHSITCACKLRTAPHWLPSSEPASETDRALAHLPTSQRAEREDKERAAQARSMASRAELLRHRASIQALEEAQDWKAISEELHTMEKAGVDADSLCFSAAARVAGNAKKWHRVERLAEKMWLRDIAPSDAPRC